MPTSISGTYQLEATPRAGLRLKDRYEIVGLLDRGGTSEVFVASDALDASPVIVKWLTEAAARNPQHRMRFVLGARATLSLDHPAIARVFSVEEPPDAPPYLVMELLQGESLADYLDREGAMPEALVVELAIQVASGLAAAHAAGIVHRDIKPGNLYLLGPKGAPRAIKLIDFGLSKDLQRDGLGPNSRNLVLGTAQYMAPEQVLADPVDIRTDIYAFGVVLFRMLTGQLPFDADAGVDLLSHQLFSRAPPPSWLVESVDPRLEQLILRCLHKHPENRYPRIQILLEDLELIANSAPSGRQMSVPQMPRSPDIYKPHNTKGRGVAEALAGYFGAETPPPATSRLGTESNEPVLADAPQRTR